MKAAIVFTWDEVHQILVNEIGKVERPDLRGTKFPSMMSIDSELKEIRVTVPPKGELDKNPE